MKWKSDERPKKVATVMPMGASKRTMGSVNVDPGGPAIYRAAIGKVKSFDSARTTTICAKWRTPAMILARRSLAGFSSLLIPENVQVRFSLFLLN